MTARVRNAPQTAPNSQMPRRDGVESGVGAVLPHRLRPPRSLVPPIERRFLLGRIEEGLAGQIVSLQAPAGFGKTELLTSAFEKLRRPGDRFCWMTLDEADRDPCVFLHDLVAAIALADQSPVSRSATAIPAIGGTTVETAIATLRQALLARATPTMVFLDDFHIPSSPEFRATVEQLLRRLPDNTHFVLASRSRPDIPLSRLRTRNLLVEIKAADLAFTPGDVQRLIGGTLPPDDLRRAFQATGGWPALVHLSLPALQSTGDPDARAQVLAGTHPLFRDFLDEELMAELPMAFRRALEVCAILDAFPLDLVADLAGMDVGPNTMAMIATLSPVLEPLADRPRWLRLHPVACAALLAGAALRSPAEHAAFHVRAASWFAERGILDKAVRHASQGGDFALAVEAIRRAGGVNIFLRAGYTVLTRLLADLPVAVIHQSPILRLCHALVLSKEGQIQAAREIMDDLKRADIASSPQSLAIPPVDLEHIDGMIDIYEDKNLGEEQIIRLRRAAQDFASYDNWERGWIYNHLCIAYQRKGDLRAGRLTGLRALSCYREEKTPYAQIFMMGHVGAVLMETGRLSAAINLLRETERLVQETQWTDMNLMALVHIPLATALYHQGQVSEAARLLGAAMPVASRGEGWVDMFARGFCTLARARFLAEGLEAGLSVLDEAEVLAIERALPRLEISVALLRVMLLTRAGLLDSALQLMQRLPDLGAGDAADPQWPTLRERHEALRTKAQLLVRLGQPEAGLALATTLLQAAEAADAGLDLLAGRVVAMEAFWALDRPEEAMRQLLAALAFAIPQKATQLMRDGDAPVAAVLRALIRRFGLTTFRPEGAAYLGAILGPLRPRQMGELSSSATVILTTREAEVLVGLDRGAANKEIARDLGLTEAAVKFHLKNLFRKLGVSRRALAIGVARDVGLLRGD